jgi:hypothetical protein
MKKLLLLSFLSLGSVLAAQPCATGVANGSSSNMFTNIRNGTTPVAANKNLNTVVFVHRNNASAFGGSSGNLRYDVSTDGGTTWTNDVGVVNPLQTLPARYPNAVIYNPVGNTTPNNAFIGYHAPLISGTAWTGYVNGVRQLNGTGNTENYNQAATTQTLIPHSYVTGAPGVFWALDLVWNGTNATGLRILKGQWTGTDISWTTNATLTPNFNTAYNGLPNVGDYHIAFDPSGQIGWVSLLTHLTPGPTAYSYYPVFWRTTDGGNTWSAPEQVDLNQYPCITGNIAAGNFATTAFESALTVDVNGEPHLLTTICNGNNAYAVFFGLWHHMYDITKTSGLWNAVDIANVQAGRGTWGVSPNTTTMDMAPQITRTADGTKIFFGWADNSSYTAGSANQTPNLFISGYNVTTQSWTTVRDVTACQPTLNGAAFYPHFAREVLEPLAGQYKIAAVVGIFTANDPINVANFRFLNNITFSNTDFTIAQPTATVNIDQGATYIKCTSAVATLSVTGSYNSLLWSNGATTSSTAVNAIGSVTLTARSGCTIGRDSISIVQLAVDTAGITNICVGGSTLLSVVGNALSYTWNPGNVAGNAINVSPAVTTTYTLSSAGTGGCVDNTPITVTVDTARVHVSPAAPTVCAGDQLTLTATGVASYNWQAPLSSTSTTVTVTPTQNIAYVVDGVSAGGCASSDTVNVTAIPLPVVTPTVSTVTLCANDSAIVCPPANLPVIISGPGIFSNTFDPALTGPGTFPVTYSYTDINTGCTGTAIVQFVVNPAPVAAITTASTVVCAGSSATLNGSGANNYAWLPGNQISSSITVTPSATTTYVLTVTDNNNCSDNDTLTLTVNPLPVLTATSSDSVACLGEQIVLSATGALTYIWNPGNLGGQSVVVTPAATTTYTVTGSDVFNCAGQTQITLTVAPSPNVIFNSPAVLCVTDGPRTITGGLPAGGNYFGPGVSGGQFSPSVSGVGTFNIGYSYTNASGCSDTAYVLYTVNACVGIGENTLTGVSIYPNPFSQQFVVEGLAAGDQLELTDALGRSVLRAQATRERETLDTSMLPAGIYMLRITRGEGVLIQKVVKE